jgi:hypothetical protein
MKQLKFLAFGIALGIISCNSTNNSLAQENQGEYDRYKAKFDNNLISQFPKKLSSEINSMTANTSSQKNRIGLLLYEYEISTTQLDSVVNFVNSINTIAKYRSSDTCLLVVNTVEVKPVKDSLIIERQCYNHIYPIPNFIEYKGRSITECGLDSTFVIYILEAKSGKYSEKYDVKPFGQMPKNWRNGYSKGIAISKQNMAVVYWSIVW